MMMIDRQRRWEAGNIRLPMFQLSFQISRSIPKLFVESVMAVPASGSSLAARTATAPPEGCPMKVSLLTPSEIRNIPPKVEVVHGRAKVEGPALDSQRRYPLFYQLVPKPEIEPQSRDIEIPRGPTPQHIWSHLGTCNISYTRPPYPSGSPFRSILPAPSH